MGGNALAINGHDYKHYDNVLDAQMSVPFTAALALLHGDVTAQMFLPQTMAQPELRTLVARIDARIDAECESIYPARRSAVVSIALKDGRRLEQRVYDPKGESDNPLSDADLERKFTTNCEPVIGAARCAALLDCVRGFEKLDGIGAIFG